MSSNAKVIYGVLTVYVLVAVLIFVNQSQIYQISLADYFVDTMFLISCSMAVTMWITGFVLLLVEAFDKRKTGRFRTAGGSFILAGVLILLIGTSLCFGAISL